MRVHRILACVMAPVMAGAVFITVLRPAQADVGDISVGGVWVARISHGAGGFSADQRAAEVNKRITEILSNPRYRHAGTVVSVKPMGAAAAILVGDQLAFTVMPEDAEGTGVTAAQLAKQWAARLAQGLSKAIPDANFHTF